MTRPSLATPWRTAREQIEKAAGAKKCWRCGCLHSSLAAIEGAFPSGGIPDDLAETVEAARHRLEEVRYDCLGCAVCFPALALNALQAAGAEVADGCPAQPVTAREGWPPLPGDYTVRRYRAPVAVCTLTSTALACDVDREAGPEVSLVGSLQTENLGIERLITNVTANPHLRFLVLCGPDSRRRIGHLPGQSLVALAQGGVDEKGRIVGAEGRRPVLRNVSPAAIDYFRRNVEVVDRIGVEDLTAVLEVVADCADRGPGSAESFAETRRPEHVTGHLPERMVPDPAGYVVIYVDHRRKALSLEHYGTDGALTAVFEGVTAAEIYTPVIERELVTRLDHAAYLGRELARAEAALQDGGAYIQDGAPARPLSEEATESGSCGCGSSCGGER